MTLHYAKFMNWIYEEATNGLFSLSEINQMLGVDNFYDHFATFNLNQTTIPESDLYEAYKSRCKLVERVAPLGVGVQPEQIFYDSSRDVLIYSYKHTTGNVDVYAGNIFDNTMSYFIFPANDTSKQAIAFLNIDMTESNFCGKIAHRVKGVWIDNSYRGKGYAALLYQTPTRIQNIPLVCDNWLSSDGVMNLKRLANLNLFDVSYYDKTTNSLSMNAPEDILTTKENSYRIILEVVEDDHHKEIYFNSTIFS
jgi:hypothetical protein